jgi:hypothetical protein
MFEEYAYNPFKATQVSDVPLEIIHPMSHEPAVLPANGNLSI